MALQKQFDDVDCLHCQSKPKIKYSPPTTHRGGGGGEHQHYHQPPPQPTRGEGWTHRPRGGGGHEPWTIYVDFLRFYIDFILMWSFLKALVDGVKSNFLKYEK